MATEYSIMWLYQDIFVCCFINIYFLGLSSKNRNIFIKSLQSDFTSIG